MIWHLCGVPAECYNILTLTVYTILYISMSASVILFQRPVHGLWVCNAFFFFEMMVSSFSLSFLKSHPLRETILVTFICDFPSCLYNNIPSPLSHIHTLKKITQNSWIALYTVWLSAEEYVLHQATFAPMVCPYSSLSSASQKGLYAKYVINKCVFNSVNKQIRQIDDFYVLC